MNAKGNWTLYTGTYTKVCVQGHIYGAYNPNLYTRITSFTLRLRGWLALNRAIEIKIPPSQASMWIYWIGDKEDQYILSSLGQQLTKFTRVEYDLNDIGTGFYIEAYDWHPLEINGTDVSSIAYPPSENYTKFSLYRKDVEEKRYRSYISYWESFEDDDARKEEFGILYDILLFPIGYCINFDCFLFNNTPKSSFEKYLFFGSTVIVDNDKQLENA